MVTLGIIVMEKEKIDLGLRALVLSVKKMDIESSNALFQERKLEP